MDLSIVIPLLNEAETLPELTSWIRRTCQQHQFTYEIILIDDGSTDESWAVIHELAGKDQNIKGIKFQRNYGKSAALNEGFKANIPLMRMENAKETSELPRLRFLAA